MKEKLIKIKKELIDYMYELAEINNVTEMFHDELKMLLDVISKIEKVIENLK